MGSNQRFPRHFQSLTLSLISIYPFLSRFSDGKNTEAYFLESLVGKNITPIEEKCRLKHSIVDLLEIKLLELIPLGENGNGMRTLAGFHDIRVHDEVFILHGARHLGTNLSLGNLRIIHMDPGAFGQEIPADRDRCGLAGVIGIFLECKPEYRNMLS